MPTTAPGSSDQSQLLPFDMAPEHPTYATRAEHYAYPCAVCGRGLSDTKVASGWWVHLVNGGSHIAPVTMTDTDPSSDLGWFPVGPDCASTIPRTHRTRTP